jgi:hypothetical protein
LPLEQKLALRLDDNNIGYLPIDASIQGASAVHKAIRPNQNESFFVTHDRGPDHPDTIAGKPLRGRNQWPPGLPGLRADMMAYFDALRAMCDRMLPPFVMALAPRSFPGPFCSISSVFADCSSPFAPIAATNRCANWCPASSPTRQPSLPGSVNRGAPRCKGFTVLRI